MDEHMQNKEKKKTIKSLTVSVMKIILKATTMNKKLGEKKWNYDDYYVCEKEYYCVWERVLF